MTESITFIHSVWRGKDAIEAKVVSDQFATLNDFLDAGCYERIESALRTHKPKDQAIAAVVARGNFMFSTSLWRTDGTWVAPV